MTDMLSGRQVGSVTPASATGRWMEGLRFGLAAAGLSAAQYVLFFVIGQVPDIGPSVVVLAFGVVGSLGALSLIVLAFVAGRRASTAGLVGIGVVVAAGNAVWVIPFLLSHLTV